MRVLLVFLIAFLAVQVNALTIGRLQEAAKGALEQFPGGTAALHGIQIVNPDAPAPRARAPKAAKPQKAFTGGTAALNGIQIVNPDAPVRAPKAPKAPKGSVYPTGTLGLAGYTIDNPDAPQQPVDVATIGSAALYGHPIDNPDSFSNYVRCFPQGEPNALKLRVGGSVKTANLPDYQAVRISAAFNCVGNVVPAVPGALKSAAGQNIVTNNNDLLTVVRKNLGNGVEIRAKAKGRGVDPSSIRGKHGMVRFELTGKLAAFSGYTDLYNGATLVEARHASAAVTAQYFQMASVVTFWELPF